MKYSVQRLRSPGRFKASPEWDHGKASHGAPSDTCVAAWNPHSNRRQRALPGKMADKPHINANDTI